MPPQNQPAVVPPQPAQPAPAAAPPAPAAQPEATQPAQPTVPPYVASAQSTGQVFASYVAKIQPGTLDPTALGFARILAEQLGKDEPTTPEMFAQFTVGILEGLALFDPLKVPEHPYLPVAKAIKALPSTDPIRETIFDLGKAAYGEAFGAGVRNAYAALQQEEQGMTWGKVADPNLDFGPGDDQLTFPGDHGPGPDPDQLIAQAKAEAAQNTTAAIPPAEAPIPAANPAGGVITPTVPAAEQPQPSPTTPPPGIPQELPETESDSEEAPNELVVEHDIPEDTTPQQPVA